jgi:hypothetical protein
MYEEPVPRALTGSSAIESECLCFEEPRAFYHFCMMLAQQSASFIGNSTNLTVVIVRGGHL